MSVKDDVAIIGMAVNLPAIDTLGDFWKLVQSGGNMVGEFPPYRRDEVTKYIRYRKLRVLKNSGGERVSFHNGSFLDNAEMFDYRFFNLTPKQASTMDPHHRLILKTLYRAVEDAGYAGDRIAGTKTGVYIGFASNPGQDYSSYLMDVDSGLAQVSLTGNVPCMLANRISHYLDLKGPSMVVDTACSASLVATLNAAKSVSDGVCEMALVAGARICTPVNELSSRIGIESSDGKTRTFDESADGTGLGEGSGAVLMKRLDKAIEDGDRIYSVIKGGAINHDGATDGITTPDAESQTQLLIAAWKDAGIDPETISYIEAHGTATRIGDPIEIDGIKKAFSFYTDKKNICSVGTVKTNIGHLFEGSGVMGLIKTSLSLHEKEMVPVGNYKKPNPLLEMEDSPIYVSETNEPWSSSNGARRAGVSAFGLGGTNCHVVLEEHEINSGQVEGEGPVLFALSAVTEKSLKNQIGKCKSELPEWIKDSKDLSDAGFTLAVGRKHFQYRFCVIVNSYEELLNSFDDPEIVKISSKTTEKVELNLQKDSQSSLKEIESARDKYLSGDLVDLSSVFMKKNKIVSMPGYQYDESDCYTYFPDVSLIADDFSGDQLLTYSVEYVSDPVDMSKFKSIQDKIVILDCEESPRCDELKQLLEVTGNDVVVAKFGDSFETDISSGVIFLEHSEKSYEKLARLIRDEGFGHIIHLTKGDKASKDIASLEDSIDRKLKSLFFLSREIIKCSFKCKLSVITENVSLVKGVDSKESLSPENSSVLGLARVIPRESPFVSVRCFDLDDLTPTRTLCVEFSLETDVRFSIYRNNKRYIEQFKYLDVDSSNFSGVDVRENGVYLITGGTGAIGLEVAKYISSKVTAKIILLSRSGLPERSQWDGLTETDGKVFRAVNSIRDIEAAGSDVSVYSADSGNFNQLKSCVDDIRSKYGNINGIVHAAGNPGKNIISMRDVEDFDSVIRPKIHGTFFLKKLTEDLGVEFMVLFSSVAAIFPTAGQGDYSAANTYMDTFSDMMNGGDLRVVSMQWAAWRDIGMAVDYNTAQDTTFKAIPTKDGIHSLFTAIKHVPSRVFVGEINYSGEIVVALERLGIKMSSDISNKIRFSQKALLDKEKDLKESAGKLGEESANVKLTGRASEAYSDTEKSVANVWGESLGYEELDVTERFTDIGGESITAMTIVRNLDEVLGVTLDVGVLIEYSTIEELSKYIDSESVVSA